MKKKEMYSLERALFDAARSSRRKLVQPSSQWQENLMADLRRFSKAPFYQENGDFLRRFALRLSVAAAIVALLLLVYTAAYGLIDYEELAMMFLEDPARFLI